MINTSFPYLARYWSDCYPSSIKRVSNNTISSNNKCWPSVSSKYFLAAINNWDEISLNVSSIQEYKWDPFWLLGNKTIWGNCLYIIWTMEGNCWIIDIASGYDCESENWLIWNCWRRLRSIQAIPISLARFSHLVITLNRDLHGHNDPVWILIASLILDITWLITCKSITWFISVDINMKDDGYRVFVAGVELEWIVRLVYTITTVIIVITDFFGFWSDWGEQKRTSFSLIPYRRIIKVNIKWYTLNISLHS